MQFKALDVTTHARNLLKLGRLLVAHRACGQLQSPGIAAIMDRIEERVTLNMLVMIYRGSQAQKVRQHGYDDLPLYGEGGC